MNPETLTTRRKFGLMADPANIKEKIGVLNDNDELRLDIVRNARKKVENEFSTGKMAKSLAKIFKNI